MRDTRSRAIDLATPVAAALEADGPVVALESAVFSHGLPADDAHRLARRLDEVVRRVGATPALVAVRDGRIEVGGGLTDLTFLLDPAVLKVAERDLAVAVSRRRSGGTTVSATLAIAHHVGIRVLATGGIGGVHIGGDLSGDVSADLLALSRYPVVVVCAGAKAICDAARTAEALDTLGVTVVGYQTESFPRFFARSSGIPVPHRAETPHEIAAIAQAKSELGDRTALLVVQPPPAGAALDRRTVDEAVAGALTRAAAAGVSGPALTPYLLAAIAEATNGRSVTVNLALLEANAALAAEVAVAWAAARGGRTG